MLATPIIFLIFLSATLGYAAFWYGGVVAAYWNVCLVTIGVLSILYWVRVPRMHRAPPLQPWLAWPLVLLLCYVALQLVPLPLSVLRTVSPARAELVQWLTPIAPGIQSAPISVTPPAAVAQLFRILAYALVFLLVRELAWRFSDRRWVPVIPIIAIGGLEAAIGMIQYAADWGKAEAHGTYVNRDHFAGLLEMALPFAVMYGVAIWRRANLRYSSPALPALLACGMLVIAALILCGIIYSLSRMGFLVSLCSLFVVAALAIGPKLPSKRVRWISFGVVAAAIGLVFIFLPPDQLIVRFADLASSERVSTEGRLDIWRETLPLIAAYPLFGCGLGGYESAFRKYQQTMPLLSVDFAHNDYLQFLAELGAVGFAILAVLIAGVAADAVHATLEHSDVDGRSLAIACIGSLVAILLHSVVDFNLQIPANALLLGWISGIVAGLLFSDGARA